MSNFTSSWFSSYHWDYANRNLGKEMEERDRPPMYPQFPGRRPEWPNLDKEVSDTAAFAEKEMSGRLLSRVLMWFL